MVLRVALLEKPSRTGLGTYAANLHRELPRQGGADYAFSAHRLVHREARLFGKRFGGNLSALLHQYDPPAPAAGPGQLVHATSNFCFSPRANLLTIPDLNPVKLPGMGWERALFKRQARRIRSLPMCLAISETTRDEAIAAFRLDPARIVATPLGIDHQAFHPGDAPPLPWEHEAGPADSAAASGMRAKTALFVGEYRAYKGALPTIDAVAAIPDLHLARVGPPPKDEHGRHVVAHATKALGRRFHDLGHVPTARVRELYAACAVHVFPSAFEGFGLPPLEAAACGRSSVVADTRLNREHLGNHAHYVPAPPLAAAQQQPNLGARPNRDLAATPTAAQLEAAIRDALEHPVPSAPLVRLAARLRWDETARQTLAAYDAVAKA